MLIDDKKEAESERRDASDRRTDEERRQMEIEKDPDWRVTDKRRSGEDRRDT